MEQSSDAGRWRQGSFSHLLLDLRDNLSCFWTSFDDIEHRLAEVGPKCSFQLICAPRGSLSSLFQRAAMPLNRPVNGVQPFAGYA